MTTLDEARGLLARAGESWETVRAEGRAWEDQLVARSARVARAPGGRRAQPAKASAHATEALGEREQTWRLWRGGSALLRSEYTAGNETVTVVAQGPRWWRSSPSLGATSGGGGRSVSLIMGPAVVLVEGQSLAAGFDLTDAAKAHFLGRDAYVVRARPGGDRSGAQAVLTELGRGADEYQIVVDAEHAVVLSMGALASGRLFRLVETTRVVFDEAIATTLFTPDRTAADHPQVARASRRMSLAELAGSVEFTVVAPDPAPGAGTPLVSLVPAARRVAGMSHATVTYPLPRTGDTRGNVRIQLSPSELPTRASERWRAVGDCKVLDQAVRGRSRPRVRARCSGTYVELESSVLSADELVAIARSLVPLPRA